ncbi:MAG: hypothetical protein AB1560_04030 [Pseudomonadota bacterium]
MNSRSDKKTITRNKRSDNLRWLTEGLLIAGVSFLAYMASMAYEVGYAKFFAIPYALIQISLTTTLLTAGCVLLAIGISGSAFTFLLYLQKKFKLPYFYYAIAGTIVSLLPVGGVAIFIFMNNSLEQWISLIAATLLSILVVFVWPIILRRDSNDSYSERYYKHLLDESQPSLLNFFSFSRRRYGNLPFFVILLFAVVVLLSYMSGNGNAKYQESYYVLDSDPEHVVLRIYDSLLIAAPLNRKNKTITNTLVIYDLTKDGRITLRQEQVGPLNVASITNTLKIPLGRSTDQKPMASDSIESD